MIKRIICTNLFAILGKEDWCHILYSHVLLDLFKLDATTHLVASLALRAKRPAEAISLEQAASRPVGEDLGAQPPLF